MPTVKLNRKIFEKLVGKTLPDDKLKDRISMLGTDLEGIEGDDIHVEIFPNRPDMLSEQGFARAFASFIGEKTGLRHYNIKKSGYKVIVDPSVAMRPYTVAAIVKNVKFDDEKIREIMQLQEKLATTHGRNRKKSEYGFYSLERINFPVTYIAKDPKTITFKPLGFDEEMPALKVEEIHPKGKAYKWLADDWRKKGFTKYPFFIDGKNKIMAMLPYTNSNEAGKVDTTTTNVFIEATGIDMDNIKVALNILTTTLADMGGEIYSLDIEYPDKTITTPDLSPREMKLDVGYANKYLGLELKEKEIKVLLGQMGYGHKETHKELNEAHKKLLKQHSKQSDSQTKEEFIVLVPAYRADILHQVDLIEDIAIAYGYENFEEIIPNVATIAQENKFELFKNKIASLITGFGFIETTSYHLLPKNTQTTAMNFKTELVTLLDPVSEEYDTLRRWIIPCLMHALKTNKHHELPQNIFEMGAVFKPVAVSKENQTGVEEKQRLALVLCGEKSDFTKIKQILDYIMQMLALNYKTVAVEHDSFISGRAARAVVNGKKIAYLGEISPLVLKNFELEYPAAAFELNLTDLYETLK